VMSRMVSEQLATDMRSHASGGSCNARHTCNRPAIHSSRIQI
jgi:hypothetical protein